MNEKEFKIKLDKYNKNTFLLFLLQRIQDEKIRKEICVKCNKEKRLKRGCINHNGKTFCKLLNEKRKKNKKLNYAWKFNLLNNSPYIQRSKLLSEMSNSINIC